MAAGKEITYPMNRDDPELPEGFKWVFRFDEYNNLIMLQKINQRIFGLWSSFKSCFLIEPRYDRIEEISGKKAWVLWREDKCGLFSIDKVEFILPIEFDSIGYLPGVEDDFVSVRKGGRIGIANMNGFILWS